VRGLIDANTPIGVTTSWRDQDKIIQARAKIADALVQQCIDNGLTVATARDVFDRAEAKLEMLINDCPVAQLCTRPTSPTGSQKP
jgi:hypothetical protein